jgi:ankyrin repeat protein
LVSDDGFILILCHRFRWVSCQIEAVRRCLAPSLRRILEELPETLDETYERILHGIPKANQVHARRLLQCLTVAIRPLRVHELAEVLAVEFSPDGGLAKLNEDLRWEDQEQAVLSACSSLVTVVDFRGSRLVQFSHFSVKEFLTSGRLAASMVETSFHHHIHLESAHTIMAQACMGVLLRLEFPMNKERLRRLPLADYAAKHFADHAEFGDVISQVTDGVDRLLDADKPHYSAWMSHISSSWWEEKDPGRPKASPLYHVADLGFCGLVHHLILKRPQDVMLVSGVRGTPVHAALHRRRVKVVQLLLSHCKDMDIRGADGQTPLHVAASNGLLDATRMVIDHGVDVNARDSNGWTPLHQAVDTYPLANDKTLDIVQLLLEHGADVGAQDNELMTPMHLAAKNGQFVAAQQLLRRGASVHAENESSSTPLHHASFYGYPDIIRLLLEHGADIEAQNKDQRSSLHLAASEGKLAAVRVLLEHHASTHAQDDTSWTPLHHASYYGFPEVIELLLEQGANLEARDKDEDSSLNLAISAENALQYRYCLSIMQVFVLRMGARGRHSISHHILGISKSLNSYWSMVPTWKHKIVTRTRRSF